MKRKDYILIAEALKRAARHANGGDEECGIFAATEALADALQADNPKGFDREMFLQNAGVTER